MIVKSKSLNKDTNIYEMTTFLQMLVQFVECLMDLRGNSLKCVEALQDAMCTLEGNDK